MITKHTRILMAEADASGGNGAAPALVVETPAEPAAQQPAAPAPVVDVDAIAAKVRDSLFAEMRKAGVFGKPPKTPPTETPAPSATSAQPDALKLRALDRALTKAGLATRLSDSQYQRAEKAFASEDPGDVDGWVKDYFDGFNGSPTPPPVPALPAAPQPKPQLANPVSDRGSPPPSQVPLAEADLVTMSESDRAHLIKEKGLVWYKARLSSQLKGRTLTLR